MKWMDYIVLICAILLFTLAVEAQPITPPAEITAPGTYELTSDARGISDVYGIKVLSSDVIIDGKNYFIGGTKRDKSVGVLVNKYGDSLKNVTIKNLKLENWDSAISYKSVKGDVVDNNRIQKCSIVNSNTGIGLEYTDHITIDSNSISETSKPLTIASHSNNIEINENSIKEGGTGILIINAEDVNLSLNNVNSCQVYGIELTDVDGVNIIKNAVSYNKYAALKIDDLQNAEISGNNFSKTDVGPVFVIGSQISNLKVVDNYFASAINIDADNVKDGIIWNTTLHEGTNILGGPYSGGNYWSSSEADGYSDTAKDEDGYGICDKPYEINALNTDYFPLHPTAQKVTAPPHVTIIPALPLSPEELAELSAQNESVNESANETSDSEQNVSFSQTTANITGNLSSDIENQSVTNAYAVDEVEGIIQTQSVPIETEVPSVTSTPPIESTSSVASATPGIGYLKFSALVPGSTVTLVTSTGNDVVLDKTVENSITIPVPTIPQIYTSYKVDCLGYSSVSGVISPYPGAGETIEIPISLVSETGAPETVVSETVDSNQTNETIGIFSVTNPVETTAEPVFSLANVYEVESNITDNYTNTEVFEVDIGNVTPETVNETPINGTINETFNETLETAQPEEIKPSNTTVNETHVNITINESVGDETVHFEPESIALTNAASVEEDTYYSISASAGPGGAIFPEGTIKVNAGESVSFIMTPKEGKTLTSLVVDGVTRPTAYEYRFNDVSGDHIIVAGFA